MSFSPAAHTPSPSHPGLPARAPLSLPTYSRLETPPPPPPKPGSHEQSRQATPLTGSSLSGSPVAAHGQSTPSGAQAAGDVPKQVPAPAIEEGWLPEGVRDKSIADLRTILDNPALLSGLASQHPSHAASVSALQAALANNKALATHLLSLEAELSALRAGTETLLLQHQSLDLAWRRKQAEVDAALEPWSPKALYQRLIAGIAEQEAVVRAVEESFLEGGVEERKASEREVVDWSRRIRSEAAKLEARREAKNRWDEGRVGGWR